MVMDIINNFFEKNIRTATGYFKINDMIESPVISLHDLNHMIRDSHYRASVIEKYGKELDLNLNQSAHLRDVDTITYLLDFIDEGHEFGQKLLTLLKEKNTTADTDTNTTTDIADGLNLLINEITSCGHVTNTTISSQHKAIIQFVVDITVTEIIRIIKQC